MYEELVKQLQYCATHDCTHEGEIKVGCTAPYEHRDGITTCSDVLMLQAADAIEKLIEIIQNHDFLENLIKPCWIPVTERLPEKYGTYLVTTKRGSVMVGCYYPKAQNWNIRATAAYWMPFPEPPKEEI